MGLAPGQSRAGFHAAIGRLVADVKILAKELVRMRDYSLTALAKDQILPQENPDLRINDLEVLLTQFMKKFFF